MQRSSSLELTSWTSLSSVLPPVSSWRSVRSLCSVSTELSTSVRLESRSAIAGCAAQTAWTSRKLGFSPLALAELAAEYDVDRKTIRRRLDAAELAEAERARRRAAKRAEEKRMRRLLGSGYRNPERAPEHAARPASRAGRRRASGGRILRLDRPSSYADWLDERDARLSAAPDPHVQLMTDSGKTIASTRESNAERMSAALEPRFGPLTTVPA